MTRTITPTATAFPTPLPFAVTTRLYLFNGGSQIMPITPDDITLGYVENPTRPLRD